MVVECAKCKGKGWNTEDMTCLTCGGAGQVEVPNNAVKCAKCQGQGWNIDDITCRTCSGTGYATLKTYN